MCCRRYRSGLSWHKRCARLGNRPSRSSEIAMKSAVFAPVALALGTLALAACGGQKAPRAGEAAKAPQGISVSGGQLVLPAVRGNPGAVYFTLHNDSASDATIESAEGNGAQSAMIHQTTTANGMSGMQMM